MQGLGQTYQSRLLQEIGKDGFLQGVISELDILKDKEEFFKINEKKLSRFNLQHFLLIDLLLKFVRRLN